MKASSIINLAQSTSLKQLNVRNDRLVVLQYINLAILELHKKFVLLEKEAVITMVDGVTSYLLDGTDLNVAIDLSDNTLLKITEAVDVDDEPLSINKSTDEEGIKLPSPNKVVVKTASLVAGNTITITYRAAPLFMTDEDTDTNIPQQFITPILNYVAYCGYGSINSDEPSETNVHYKRFLASCADIDIENLGEYADLSSSNLTTRGFV